MTRWARANDAHKKTAEEATKWEDMWKTSQDGCTDKDNESEKTGDDDDDERSQQSSENDSKQNTSSIKMENNDVLIVNCEKSGSNEHEEKRCNFKRHFDVVMSKESTFEKSNNEVQCCDTQNGTKNDTTNLESKDHVGKCQKCGSNEHEETRCKLRRSSDTAKGSAMTKGVCFRCRKKHLYADCPLMSEEDKMKICFKCGSMEHVTHCTKRIEGFPFARCFICNETGHLSRQCPKNANGIYIYGGGCHICDGKDHYARNCHKKKKAIEENEVVLTIQENKNESVEAEDSWFRIDKKPAKISDNIVKF